MIEQVTVALEQKGQNFSAWVIEACRQETNVRKRRAYTSIKVMKNEKTSAFFHSEQDDIVNSLNYEGIATVIGYGFTTFLTVTDTCWLCHELNSLNDCDCSDQSTAGNNPSYYYRASWHYLSRSEYFQDTLCSIHAITTSG